MLSHPNKRSPDDLPAPFKASHLQCLNNNEHVLPLCRLNSPFPPAFSLSSSSGAGIAGLTLAIALNEFDKERRYVIDIYETAPELSEIGAGIMMYPKTLHVMEEIGASETLIPCFDHLPDNVPRASYWLLITNWLICLFRCRF